MTDEAPTGEADRLVVLQRACLLDTVAVPAFDELTRLAARLFTVPIATIGLIDADRVWFKSAVGLEVRQVGRAGSLDEAALRAGGLFVVEDVAGDPALAAAPLVAGAPHVRFYAAAPLAIAGGTVVGALAVMDTRPRRLTGDEGETLRALAGHAVALIELSLERADLESARNALAGEFALRSQHLADAQRMAQVGSWEYLIAEDRLIWTDEVFRFLGLDPTTVPTPALWQSFVHPDDRERLRQADAQLRVGLPIDMEFRIVRADGELRYVWTRAEVLDDGHGRRIAGIAQDITDRRRMETRLSQAESDLALASRLARMGAWSVDLRTRKVMWSDEVYAVHEVEAGTEISFEQGISYFAPDDREAADLAFVRCARDGVPFDREQQLITARGRRVWVRGIGRPVRDEQGTIVAVQGAFQDIDAQKRNELEVRRLAERLETTLESITEAFLTLDRDWRFTYMNAEAERQLDRRRADLLGRNVWDEFPEIVGTRFEEHYRRAMETGASASFEEPFHLLGKLFDIRCYPSSEGLAIYFQDITQAKAAIDRLRESEERFKLAARATADIIWDNDLRTGKQWWSEAFALRLGYSPDELPPCSESWRRVVHPDDIERVLAAQRAAFDKGGESWEADYRLIGRDGAILHVRDRAFLMRAADGTVIREIGGLTDISHRVEYEERLHQAQRLEAIGQLTGGIAHDFNNLLTVILGNAELLTERLSGDDRSRRLAAMSAAAAQRGAELTNRLLAFARRQALHPRAIDANRLIAGMDGLLRRTLGEAIELEFVRGGGLWHPLADPAQLESAILNLGINARDAMPGGGRLSIETANVRLDDSYAAVHEDVASGQYVMIAVADTGTGMAPEVIAQAFEPFFSTKGMGKGSGLGLSVIYGFVKQSGGHVKIYSEVGEGTTVKLYLPRADVIARPEDDVVDLRPEQGGAERILLVEDDDLVRGHVTDQLESLGYSVVVARNGPEAIRILQTGRPFDLLFTDIVMPGGMNGREVAEAATAMRPGLRVLFTSGYTENAIVHHGRLDRDVHLINKPYRRQDLARKLRVVLEEPPA